MAEALLLKSSGGVTSDDVTAAKYDVIQGKKTITTDSNDEVAEGTFPVHPRGTVTPADPVETRLDGNTSGMALYINEGAYYSDKSSGLRPFVAAKWERLRNIIGATNTAKWRKDTTIAGRAGTMPEQGGSTIIPGTTNKTAVVANRFVTANINVAGDPNLKAANIKKGVTLFGVKGTHDGWVPGSGDIYKLGTMGLMTGCTAIRPGSENYDNWIMGITCKRYYETGNIRLVNGYHDSIVIDNAINLAGWSKINVEASWESRLAASTDFALGIRSTKVNYFSNAAGDVSGGNVPFEAKTSKSVALDEHPTKNIVSLDITNINGMRYIYFEANGFSLPSNNQPENVTYIHRIWLS